MWIYVLERRDKRRPPAASLPVMVRQRCLIIERSVPAFCSSRKPRRKAIRKQILDLGFSGSNTRRGRVGQDIAHTLETSCIQGIVERGGRIRRLMPRECLRLQGFDEWQIDRILAIQSDAQAYKQAGNSVTVNVIEAIAKRIQTVDEELKAGAAA